MRSVRWTRLRSGGRKDGGGHGGGWLERGGDGDDGGSQGEHDDDGCGGCGGCCAGDRASTGSIGVGVRSTMPDAAGSPASQVGHSGAPSWLHCC